MPWTPLAGWPDCSALENMKIGGFLHWRCLGRGETQYEGATSGYHDFLLPFMQLVGNLPVIRGASVYVLLDDADRLNRVQQRIVNSWVANRDNQWLCVKVSGTTGEVRTRS